jgi:hypothetical protein
MRLFLLPWALLMFCFSATIAQTDFRPGFIITKDNDTVFGKPDFRSISGGVKSITFVSETGSKEYFPDQIKGYGFINNKYFSSGIIPEFFVEIVIRGKLNLYRHDKTFYVQKDTGRVVKMESIVVPITTQYGTKYRTDERWRGVLKFLTSDNPEVSKKTSTLNLSERSLVRFVTDYNKLDEKVFVDFRANLPWIQGHYGMGLGTTGTTITLTSTYQEYRHLPGSLSSVDPMVGLVYHLTMPRLSERISLQAEMIYMYSHFYTLTESRYIYNKELNDVNINLNTFTFPVSLRYLIMKKKLPLFAYFGAGYILNFKSEASLRRETISNFEVNTTIDDAFPLAKTEIGFRGGVGIKKTFPWFNAELHANFQSNSVDKTALILSSMNKYTVALIIFRK